MPAAGWIGIMPTRSAVVDCANVGADAESKPSVTITARIAGTVTRAKTLMEPPAVLGLRFKSAGRVGNHAPSWRLVGPDFGNTVPMTDKERARPADAER